jgi:hypothetical protein
MIDSNQKKFLVLYLIPASVVEKWSKTDPNERKAAEEKMRGEWDNWMRAHVLDHRGCVARSSDGIIRKSSAFANSAIIYRSYGNQTNGGNVASRTMRW